MEKFDETKLKLFGGKDEEKIERIMDVTTGGVAVFPLIPKSVTLPDDSDRSIEAAIEIAQNLEEAIASIQYYEKELASARKELQEIVEEKETIHIECQFCDTIYDFSSNEIQEILKEL